MRLTFHTDYALRMLVYLAMRDGEPCTVSDVARTYALSRSHLIKVAQGLRDLSLIETLRGRNGGIRLAKEPEQINIGELVRRTEPDFALVECMQREGGQCVLSPACMLKGMFSEALAAYLAVLDRYTLADAIRNRRVLGSLLGLERAA